MEISTPPPANTATDAIEQEQEQEQEGDAPSIRQMQAWDFDKLVAYRKQVSKSESRARLENLSTKDFWANRKELVDELYRARIAAEGIEKKAYNVKPKKKGGAHELYLNI